MVLEGEKVGVGLEAHSAVIDADGMRVLVVEEGAGVAVGTTTLVTSVQRQRKKKVGGGGRGTKEGRLIMDDGNLFTIVAT